jgi:anti-sigma factor ChrR (cupin superfamily)
MTPHDDASHQRAYAAFMLDYAAGTLPPAERLAADIHRALSPKGASNAHLMDAVGGALLEQTPGRPIEAVDAAAKSGATSVYVEILSKHGVRVLKAEHDEEPQQDA